MKILGVEEVKGVRRVLLNVGDGKGKCPSPNYVVLPWEKKLSYERIMRLHKGEARLFFRVEAFAGFVIFAVLVLAQIGTGMSMPLFMTLLGICYFGLFLASVDVSMWHEERLRLGMEQSFPALKGLHPSVEVLFVEPRPDDTYCQLELLG